MKKTIITFAMITVLALTFGAAYAMEGGIELNNGITDFSGRSYEIVPDFGPAASAVVDTGENWAAGGPRSDDPGIALENGITDFSGRSYEMVPDFGLAASEVYGDTMESADAGGLRSEEPVDAASNGITNFSGKSYDTLSDLDR
jgi:hypothetical protein